MGKADESPAACSMGIIFFRETAHLPARCLISLGSLVHQCGREFIKSGSAAAEQALATLARATRARVGYPSRAVTAGAAPAGSVVPAVDDGRRPVRPRWRKDHDRRWWRIDDAGYAVPDIHVDPRLGLRILHERRSAKQHEESEDCTDDVRDRQISFDTDRSSEARPEDSGVEDVLP
jgi:hypothetical protein